MSKLVGKTIAITLAVIVGLLAVTFGAFALFSPKVLGNMFSDMGAYSASVHFYESQYSKTESLDDLALLIDKLDFENDTEKAKDYLGKMVLSQGFSEYCSSIDSSNSLIPVKDYYNGLYAEALFVLGQEDSAISFCASAVASGYGEFNPFRALISIDGVTDIQLEKIKQAIENQLANLSLEEQDIATNDIADIDTLING